MLFSVLEGIETFIIFAYLTVIQQCVRHAICFGCKRLVVVYRWKVASLLHPAVRRMSGRGTPSRFAAEVEAALVECGLKCPMSTPA